MDPTELQAWFLNLRKGDKVMDGGHNPGEVVSVRDRPTKRGTRAGRRVRVDFGWGVVVYHGRNQSLDRYSRIYPLREDLHPDQYVPFPWKLWLLVYPWKDPVFSQFEFYHLKKRFRISTPAGGAAYVHRDDAVELNLYLYERRFEPYF